MKTALGDTSDLATKRNAASLVWKDSARMMNHLRTHNVDIGSLVAYEPRLQFLLPVRNPLDCARSHVKTGGGPQFDEPSDSLEVLDSLFQDFAWFRDLQRQYPDRFFHFFEFQVDSDLLAGMANFLGIEADTEWMERALSAYEVGSTYEHSDDEWYAYRRCVDKWFAADVEFRTYLMEFVPKSSHATVGA